MSQSAMTKGGFSFETTKSSYREMGYVGEDFCHWVKLAQANLYSLSVSDPGATRKSGADPGRRNAVNPPNDPAVFD